MEGWFKLHRKILDNPVVCKDSDYIAIWIYLLSEAAHTEIPALFKGQRILLKPGQLLTGRRRIAEKFKVDESKVQRVLKKFETEQQIEQQTSNENRLITIVNWHLYQQSEQQNEQRVNNECTTNEQRVNTKQECKNDKECNNIYNIPAKPGSGTSGKAKYSEGFEEFWNAYPRKADKGTAYKKYNARLKSGFSAAELLTAAIKYAEQCKNNQTEEKYIKHASTFLGDATPFIDYLKDDGNDGSQTVTYSVTQKGRNQFNNFPQRDYGSSGFSDLERQLLQKGMK